jgi:hypothetical protein
VNYSELGITVMEILKSGPKDMKEIQAELDMDRRTQKRLHFICSTYTQRGFMKREGTRGAFRYSVGEIPLKRVTPIWTKTRAVWDRLTLEGQTLAEMETNPNKRKPISTALTALIKSGLAGKLELNASRWEYFRMPGVTPPWADDLEPAELPEFDTVAWLGSIMRGKPPLPEGRKVIAQEMMCAE